MHLLAHSCAGLRSTTNNEFCPLQMVTCPIIRACASQQPTARVCPGRFSKITTHNPGAGAAVISASPTQNVKHGAFRSSATLKYRLSPKLHPPLVDFGLTVPRGHVCAARFGRNQQQWWPWQPLETVLKAILLVPADLVLCTSFLVSFHLQCLVRKQPSIHR